MYLRFIAFVLSIFRFSMNNLARTARSSCLFDKKYRYFSPARTAASSDSRNSFRIFWERLNTSCYRILDLFLLSRARICSISFPSDISPICSRNYSFSFLRKSVKKLYEFLNAPTLKSSIFSNLGSWGLNCLTYILSNYETPYFLFPGQNCGNSSVIQFIIKH